MDLKNKAYLQLANLLVEEFYKKHGFIEGEWFHEKPPCDGDMARWGMSKGLC